MGFIYVYIEYKEGRSNLVVPTWINLYKILRRIIRVFYW